MWESVRLTDDNVANTCTNQKLFSSTISSSQAAHLLLQNKEKKLQDKAVVEVDTASSQRDSDEGEKNGHRGTDSLLNNSPHEDCIAVTNNQNGGGVLSGRSSSCLTNGSTYSTIDSTKRMSSSYGVSHRNNNNAAGTPVSGASRDIPKQGGILPTSIRMKFPKSAESAGTIFPIAPMATIAPIAGPLATKNPSNGRNYASGTRFEDPVEVEESSDDCDLSNDDENDCEVVVLDKVNADDNGAANGAANDNGAANHHEAANDNDDADDEMEDHDRRAIAGGSDYEWTEDELVDNAPAASAATSDSCVSGNEGTTTDDDSSSNLGNIRVAAASASASAFRTASHDDCSSSTSSTTGGDDNVLLKYKVVATRVGKNRRPTLLSSDDDNCNRNKGSDDQDDVKNESSKISNRDDIPTAPASPTTSPIVTVESTTTSVCNASASFDHTSFSHENVAITENYGNQQSNKLSKVMDYNNDVSDTCAASKTNPNQDEDKIHHDDTKHTLQTYSPSLFDNTLLISGPEQSHEQDQEQSSIDNNGTMGNLLAQSHQHLNNHNYLVRSNNIDNKAKHMSLLDLSRKILGESSGVKFSGDDSSPNSKRTIQHQHQKQLEHIVHNDQQQQAFSVQSSPPLVHSALPPDMPPKPEILALWRNPPTNSMPTSLLNGNKNNSNLFSTSTALSVHNFNTSKKFVFLSEEKSIPSQFGKMQEQTIQKRHQFQSKIHELECKIASITAQLANESMDSDLALKSVKEDALYKPLEQSYHRMIMDRARSCIGSNRWIGLEKQLSLLDSQMTQSVLVQYPDLKREGIGKLSDEIHHDVKVKILEIESEMANKREGTIVRKFEDLAGTMARRYQEEHATRLASFEIIRTNLQTQSQSELHNKPSQFSSQAQNGSVSAISNFGLDTTKYEAILNEIRTLRQKLAAEKRIREQNDRQLMTQVFKQYEIMQTSILEAFGDNEPISCSSLTPTATSVTSPYD